ncbi:uncharacterized protein LOC130633073 [Hydractinia symbiolongicarpus]|uniref:uncharacterized protein LOC130633073 n=1 Tax=Hydractinia symbiolongicarpus TaxID=13093 RepID=UPI00254AA943|nr:uncharacterized protein LOC130633073 [Hydractinia symbiolongicarpus]
MLTVKGKIVFSGGAPESIPNNSTLTVKFQDTNRMDAPAINLGTCVKSIQGYKKGTDLSFEIVNAKKPDFGMDGSISAVLNIGWVPSGDEWVRQGDYLNDTHHTVRMEDYKTVYNCQVEVIHYN